MNGTSLAHPVRSPPGEREWAELSTALEGELFTDTATRLCYATDASIYEQIPLAVVCPEHAGDCVAAVEFCQRHSLPLIPRAAGTSLAGQCVGTGLVLDVMRNMDVLLEVDAASQRTRVQPGLVLQALNESLRPQGLCFPIDPSTAGCFTPQRTICHPSTWGPGSRAIRRQCCSSRSKMPTAEQLPNGQGC